MNLALVLGITGTAIALIGVPVTWANWRRSRGEKTSSHFIQVHEHVRSRQSQLHTLAQSTIPPAWCNDGIPLLSKPGWIFSQPEPLESVRITWEEGPPTGDQVANARQRARRLLPKRNDGTSYSSYSSALAQLAGMSHLYNGSIYRPTEITASPGGLRLRFTPGQYFDHLDTTEILAFEAAAEDLAGRKSIAGSYRRHLRDPFDLTRRATCLGTITLTVRAGHDGCGFYMHHRDSNQVIVAPDIIHVIPADEFAPADVGLDSSETDFDLWHTVMREYAEEFLDIEEAYGRGGKPLNYEHDQPFSDLVKARGEGRMRLHALGIGMDPLTWKPELLLVCVIESATFDQIFGEMVQHGREGTILAGLGGRGIPLNARAIERYAGNPGTRCAAQACLRLTWRHRIALGLGENPSAGVPDRPSTR